MNGTLQRGAARPGAAVQGPGRAAPRCSSPAAAQRARQQWRLQAAAPQPSILPLLSEDALAEVATALGAASVALPLPLFGRQQEASKQAGAAAEDLSAVASPKARPILSCAGGGIFFFWEVGVLKYLGEHYDLGRVDLVGASAGALVATLAACNVDADAAVRAAYRLSQEAGIWDRPGGLAGVWGALLRDWLDELLPEDAAARCSGRVKLVVTEVPSLRLQYLSDFSSKQDLIDANMASVHIPFFLDGNATCSYRGQAYIDGSLWDFFAGTNSELITCDGSACVIDYFNDDQLQFSRLDFIKLTQYDQVLDMVRAGYAYAERMEAAGVFDSTLGAVRRSLLNRIITYPARQLSKATSVV